MQRDACKGFCLRDGGQRKRGGAPRRGARLQQFSAVQARHFMRRSVLGHGVLPRLFLLNMTNIKLAVKINLFCILRFFAGY
jgi:hypothetical protein